MRVRIGLVQTSASEDPKANMTRAVDLVREACLRGAQIVCLPELYRTRYFPAEAGSDASRWAETVPGESTRLFTHLAGEMKAVLVIPVCEKGAGGKNYSTAAVIDADGRLLGAYRKTHIPQDPCFFEKDCFEPGTEGFRVFDTRYAKISVLLCYDQWFPESARVCALRGADLLLCPTAIGSIQGEDMPEGDWREAWVTVQRGHAIANGVHIAAVNRVGAEDKLRFWGTSFVCNSFGTVLKMGGSVEEGTIVAEADLSLNRDVREGWGFMENRRPECYREIVGGSGGK